MRFGAPLVLLAAFLGQQFAWGDLAVIGLLILLEGVLSIDNALVLGLLAKRLPKRQRARALSYGIIGAFVFRTIAVLTASFLLQWTFVKFLGGAYLVYIAAKHLFFEAHEDPDLEKIVIDETGHPIIVDAETGGPISADQEELEIQQRVPIEGLTKFIESPADFWRFWKTVGVIELTDIAFAVDSILAAIALAGGRQDKLWVIITGGILGMILMRFAAAIFIKLLDRFPRFELAAYLLVIVIGLKLLVDWGFNSDWSFEHQPQVASRLGTWKQSFVDLEKSRRQLIRDYDQWIMNNWPFKVQHIHDEHNIQHPVPHAVPNPNPALHPDPAAAPEPAPAQLLAPHVPHLLDFHDLRFPECMAFWLIMIICFIIGFTPTKKPTHQPAA